MSKTKLAVYALTFNCYHFFYHFLQSLKNSWEGVHSHLKVLNRTNVGIVLLPHDDLYYFTDLCGYVRSLLAVQGAIFNLIPIARLLEMPEESTNKVVKCWKDEDEQLELILQHWSKKNHVVEDLAALRKDLESLQQEG